MNIALASSCCLPDGTVPSSRGTPTRSISVGCDNGAFRVPKESLAEGVTLHSKQEQQCCNENVNENDNQRLRRD